jgi:hypothetical protein
MAKEQLTELVEFGFKHARDELIGQAGEMKPTFVLVSKTGDHEIVETPFGNQFEKMGIIRTMRERMRKNGTAAYVFVSENWSAPATRDWTQGEQLLFGTHPECFETVIVSACGRDRIRRGRWKIRRDGAGTVATLEKYVLPGATTVGRFDLLHTDAVNPWYSEDCESRDMDHLASPVAAKALDYQEGDADNSAAAPMNLARGDAAPRGEYDDYVTEQDGLLIVSTIKRAKPQVEC